MAIDTLRGMRVYVDEEGVYHFLTHGARVPSAGWSFIGIMHPHMVEVAEEQQTDSPATKE